MKIHRLAKYFPILEGDEFDLLVEDIKKNGQREPIITVGDEILDGVNRYRACRKLDQEPVFESYTGDDPLAYVISLNIRRRHLSESQRAMLATEMLPEFEKDAAERRMEAAPRGGKGRIALATRDERGRVLPGSGSRDHVAGQPDHLARDDAARVFGVSGPSIQRAKRIKEKAPEKAEEIIQGRTTVGAVDNELRQAEAANLAAQQHKKNVEKGLKETPKIVKEYFDLIKVFDDKLGLAIEAAKRKLFSPESINLVRAKHEKIRNRMAKLEETISEE